MFGLGGVVLEGNDSIESTVCVLRAIFLKDAYALCGVSSGTSLQNINWASPDSNLLHTFQN